MGRMVRIFEGRFGRLVLTELAPNDPVDAQADPAIVMQAGEGDLLLLNPGEIHVCLASGTALVFHASTDWLRQAFPAIFDTETPFPRRLELILSLIHI